MALILAALSFLSPWMFAGAFLAALPIVAHILGRGARRRVVFPTIRMLSESVASTSKLYRLRRRLLLALRCLAVFLIVVAFTRPRWFHHPVPTEDLKRGAGVVLLLDASASMNQEIEGTPLFHVARALAERALDSLRPGEDRVGLIYASATPTAALPEITLDYEAIRRDLKLFRPTAHRGNFMAAIARASDLLRPHNGPRRLVILSDMQERNWNGIGSGNLSGLSLPEGTVVTIIPVGNADGANIALSRSRSIPARPLVNQAFQLQVQVTNYSPQASVVVVETSVDDISVGQRNVTLQPWVSSEVSFETTIDRPGAHKVTFSIAQDNLAADNRVFLNIDAVNRLAVAVVSDDNPHEPGTSGYFLLRALAPRGNMGDELAVYHIEGAALDFGRIADAEAVFISDVGRLGEPALSGLRMYLHCGGGVTFFCGEGAVRENLEALRQAETKSEILPWLPQAPRDLTAIGGFIRLSERQWDTDILTGFDKQCRETLRQVRFFRTFSTDTPSAGARNIMRFVDGSPAMSSLSVGNGKLVLCNFSPSLSGSELGKYGGFVAMTHALFHHIRSAGQEEAETFAGSALLIRIRGSAADPSQPWTAMGPDGLVLPIELTEQAATQFVHIREAHSPGFYEIHHGGTMERHAVNVDPLESDLRRISPKLLQQQLAGGSSAITVHDNRQAGPVLEIRGQPMWHLFFLAAMAALALELGLLCIWKQ